MAYPCIGSTMSPADWTEIHKLCKKMQDMIDQKFRDLDTGSFKIIKDRLIALENGLNAVEVEQNVHAQRITVLEENAANVEITTSEILDMYTRGGNHNG